MNSARRTLLVCLTSLLSTISTTYLFGQTAASTSADVVTRISCPTASTEVLLHQRAASSLPVLDILRCDAQVTVLEKQSEWYRVRTQSGMEGYVNAVYVSGLPLTTETAIRSTPAFADCASLSLSSVFLFQSPGGKVALQIPCAAEITVLEQNNNWDKVQTGDGSVGYIRPNFVSFTPIPPIERAPQYALPATDPGQTQATSGPSSVSGGPKYAQPATDLQHAQEQQLQSAKQTADRTAKEYADLLAEHNNLLADYNSQSLPRPYSAPSGGFGRRFLYGMGQGAAAHAGLPTDYQIQQEQYRQALEARQLAYEQLQEQYQSLLLAKQAADQAAKEYNALVNQAQQ